MGFAITYRRLFELRCWHPAYLGAAAASVPDIASVPAGQATRDLLNYDLRRFLRIRPTSTGRHFLREKGLTWKATTLGGWLLAADGFNASGTNDRLQLGVYLTDGAFAQNTDFGVDSRQGRMWYLSTTSGAAASPVSLTDGNLRGVHYFPNIGNSILLDRTDPTTSSTVSLRDPLVNGNPILRTYSLPADEQATYALDLSAVNPGLYRLTGSDITNQTFALGFQREPGLLGVVEVILDQLPAAPAPDPPPPAGTIPPLPAPPTIDIHFAPAS